MSEVESVPKPKPESSVPSRFHAEVWRLHSQEGLTAASIARWLVEQGCVTTRFSVGRLLKQLARKESLKIQIDRLREEARVDGAVAIEMRRLHESEIDDLCQRIAIAAAKGKHRRVLTLTRAARALMNTIRHYDGVVQHALKQELQAAELARKAARESRVERRSSSAVPQPASTPAPQVSPRFIQPAHEQETIVAPSQFVGTGTPGATVSLMVDGEKFPPATVDSAGRWTIFNSRHLQKGQHIASAAHVDAAGQKGMPTTIRFYTMASLLLLAGMGWLFAGSGAGVLPVVRPCAGEIRHFTQGLRPRFDEGERGTRKVRSVIASAEGWQSMADASSGTMAWTDPLVS